MTALCVLLLIAGVSAAAPWISAEVLHSDPDRFVRGDSGRIATLQPPGQDHPLGTDDLGRDALTRLLFAGRLSLLIGFGVALISLTVGAPLGLLAAYAGGRVDDALNAAVQAVLSVPLVFVLIVLSIFVTPDAAHLTGIFGLFFWPNTARQIRGVALAVRQREFVAAAWSLGASRRRILVRHLAPNVASVMLVVAGIDMAGAILAESSLSFLGFGVPVPEASWGTLLSPAQIVFRSAPWLVYPPGVMIFVTVLCIFRVTDGLRDALDPTLAWRC